MQDPAWRREGGEKVEKLPPKVSLRRSSVNYQSEYIARPDSATYFHHQTLRLNFTTVPKGSQKANLNFADALCRHYCGQIFIYGLSL